MKSVILLVVVVVITLCLGRYVMAQVQRTVEHKIFLENMKNFDKKKKNERY
jgi:ABC-type transporter Mla maintaining outer membrane lipid asymmetry permease subunit MlaE|tara:strand:+ start:2940 stop:3092 length:153 start_codon:yes stop_codon:yes gene_type:complete